MNCKMITKSKPFAICVYFETTDLEYFYIMLHEKHKVKQLDHEGIKIMNYLRFILEKHGIDLK